MFLRCKVRRKDGKQHRYWSVVENTRVGGGRVVQRHVLYLGEINDTQELAWRRSIEVLEDGAARPRTLSLFPEDRVEGLLADASVVGVRLSELRLQPEVPVEVREWIAPALASPALVLEPQPPAQPHSRVVVERAICFAGGADTEVIGPSAQRAVQLVYKLCGLLPGTRADGQRVDGFDHALDALL